MALHFKAVDATGRTHVRRSVRNHRYAFCIVALDKGGPPASWASRPELAAKERARLARVWKHVEIIAAEQITYRDFVHIDQEKVRAHRLQTLPRPADEPG